MQMILWFDLLIVTIYRLFLKERKNINNEGINGVNSYINLDLLKSYCGVFMDSIKKYNSKNNKKIT